MPLLAGLLGLQQVAPCHTLCSWLQPLGTTEAAVLGNVPACKQLDDGLGCESQPEPLLVHGIDDVFLWNENWLLLLVCNFHPAADCGHGASKWWQLGICAWL